MIDFIDAGGFLGCCVLESPWQDFIFDDYSFSFAKASAKALFKGSAASFFCLDRYFWTSFLETPAPSFSRRDWKEESFSL